MTKSPFVLLMIIFFITLVRDRTGRRGKIHADNNKPSWLRRPDEQTRAISQGSGSIVREDGAIVTILTTWWYSLQKKGEGGGAHRRC